MAQTINLNDIVNSVVKYEVGNGNLSGVVATKSDLDSLFENIIAIIRLCTPASGTEPISSDLETIFNELLSSKNLSGLNAIPELSSFSSEELLDRSTYIITEEDFNDFIRETSGVAGTARGWDDMPTNSHRDIRSSMISGARAGKETRKGLDQQKEKIIEDVNQLIEQMQSCNKRYKMDESCEYVSTLKNLYEQVKQLDQSIYDVWNSDGSLEYLIGFFKGAAYNTGSTFEGELYDIVNDASKELSWKIDSINLLQDGGYIVKNIFETMEAVYGSRLEEIKIEPEYKNPQYETYKIGVYGDKETTAYCKFEPKLESSSGESLTLTKTALKTLQIGTSILYKTSEIEYKKIMFGVSIVGMFRDFASLWTRLHEGIYERLETANATHSKLHEPPLSGKNCSAKTEWYGKEISAPDDLELCECSQLNQSEEFATPPDHVLHEDHLYKFAVCCETIHFCGRTEEMGCLAESDHKHDGDWTTPVNLGATTKSYMETMCPYHDGTDVEAYIQSKYHPQTITKESYTWNNLPVWKATTELWHINGSYNGHGDPVYHPVDVNTY